MKMTTYLQAFSLASGERERFDTVLDLQDELGMGPEEIAAVDRQLNRRQRQMIRFYDKVAKLTHAFDKRSEWRTWDGMSAISPRELEVAGLVAKDLSNKEIAVELRISVHTVKRHMTRLRIKLRQSSRLGIVMEALRRGLIEVPG